MTSADWWAKKLNQPVQPQPIMPQVPMAQPQPATYQQPLQQQYPPSVQVTPQADRCPACHSVNYGSVGSQVTQSGSVPVVRCYDCGYPKVQAGSRHGGASSAPSSGGPATPARQVATGGFNPTTIIGHL